MLPQYKDYSQLSLDRLLWQYRDSDKLQGLITAFAEELNLTQQDTFDIVSSMDIDNAFGVFLDIIGGYVGEPRLGRTDHDYRDAIILKIAINTSRGTPNDLLTALALATKADKTKIWEYYPVSTVLSTNGERFPDDLARAIQSASPATSGDITIVIDLDNSRWVGSEITQEVGDLIDHDNNQFITHNLDNIQVVRGLLVGEDERGVFSDYTYGMGTNPLEDIDGYGVLADCITLESDTSTASDAQILIFEEINNWYNLMNYQFFQGA